MDCRVLVTEVTIIPVLLFNFNVYDIVVTALRGSKGKRGKGPYIFIFGLISCQYYVRVESHIAFPFLSWDSTEKKMNRIVEKISIFIFGIASKCPTYCR